MLEKILINKSDKIELNKPINLDILKWILLIVIAESVAQYNIKDSLIKKSNMKFFFAVCGYAFVCLFLRQVYLHKGAVGMTNVIWSILSIISILIVGILFFNETINKYDMFGIVLTTIGLYFIYIKGHATSNIKVDIY